MHSEGYAILHPTGEAGRPGSHGHLKGTSMKVTSVTWMPWIGVRDVTFHEGLAPVQSP